MTEPWDADEQLDKLLLLIESTGREHVDTAALIAEHGGSLDDLRSIIARYGKVGDAMLRAVNRTRAMRDGDAK